MLGNACNKRVVSLVFPEYTVNIRLSQLKEPCSIWTYQNSFGKKLKTLYFSCFSNSMTDAPKFNQGNLRIIFSIQVRKIWLEDLVLLFLNLPNEKLLLLVSDETELGSPKLCQVGRTSRQKLFLLISFGIMRLGKLVKIMNLLYMTFKDKTLRLGFRRTDLTPLDELNLNLSLCWPSSAKDKLTARPRVFLWLFSPSYNLCMRFYQLTDNFVAAKF